MYMWSYVHGGSLSMEDQVQSAPLLENMLLFKFRFTYAMSLYSTCNQCLYVSIRTIKFGRCYFRSSSFR